MVLIARVANNSYIVHFFKTCNRLGKKIMERSKIVAIVTGAISLILAIAYLILVLLLDFRGEMLPAPMSLLFFWASF